MFKSKMEIREFAVSTAADILGSGTPDKDVIAKAKEIEAYIIGDAEIPEVYNEAEMVNGLFGSIIESLESIVSRVTADVPGNIRKGE